MKKRLLTKLLATVLCVGLVMQPVSAFANEPYETTFEEQTDDAGKEASSIEEESEEQKDNNTEEIIYNYLQLTSSR